MNQKNWQLNSNQIVVPSIGFDVSYIVVDATNILKVYDENLTLVELLPEITLHGLIAISLLGDEDTSDLIEKKLGLKIDAISNLLELSDICSDFIEMFDSILIGALKTADINIPIFWKWLDSRTLVLAQCRDSQNFHALKKLAGKNFENCLYRTAYRSD